MITKEDIMFLSQRRHVMMRMMKMMRIKMSAHQLASEPPWRNQMTNYLEQSLLITFTATPWMIPFWTKRLVSVKVYLVACYYSNLGSYHIVLRHYNCKGSPASSVTLKWLFTVFFSKTVCETRDEAIVQQKSRTGTMYNWQYIIHKAAVCGFHCRT